MKAMYISLYFCSRVEGTHIYPYVFPDKMGMVGVALVRRIDVFHTPGVNTCNVGY